MAAEKVETIVAGNYVEMEREGEETSSKSKISMYFWHGGSVYDAWFSCSSNQVAQVLLTLPYSFSQLGMISGLLFQLFYGLMGSWTAYLISALYVEYRTRKEREKVDFRNHVIQYSGDGGLMRKPLLYTQNISWTGSSSRACLTNDEQEQLDPHSLHFGTLSISASNPAMPDFA